MPDYEVKLRALQRLDLPARIADPLAALDTPARVPLHRITAIGQYGLVRSDGQGSAPSQSRVPSLPAEKLLMALSGRNVACCLHVCNGAAGVDFSVGGWGGADVGQILTTAARVAYPVFETSPAGEPQSFCDEWMSGYVLGTPSQGTASTVQGAELLPLDRLIAALGPGCWGFQILAMPVASDFSSTLRSALLDELGDVSTFVHSQRVPDPGAEHYMELLKKTLEGYNKGIAVGMWRVGVYLFGAAPDYHRLASAWKGVFSGEDSVPDSVRVIDDQRALSLARHMALPTAKDPTQHGRFRHPLAFQSLLTSAQLAAYCSLPSQEVAGLRVRKLFRLDMQPPVVDETTAWQVGEVVSDSLGAEQAGKPYRLDPAAIREHAFVAGVTGSGKTNTVFALLRCAAEWGVRFLVIEPAKGEYRRLLDTDWCQPMQPTLYTLGNENHHPIRINPFEVLGGRHKDIGKHIDLLRAVFTASFGLWSPLPEVLERCIHSVYEDCGWDPLSNTNHRIADQDRVPASAFPTLSDLVAKVESVLDQLGYDKETTSRMRAALVARLDGLRAGAKGTMLDCQQLTDMQQFLSHATVLELQDLGNDDDKAFVMGLLMIRLAEYLDTLGDSQRRLRQILVIEEAHRLLGQTAPKASEQGDARAKAVEVFSNMLAEVRSRGLSIIIADQSPSSMAPSVIRNTNLKIIHRLLAREERHIMAGAVNLSDEESSLFTTLANGHAAFFGTGDDRPVLVRVDAVKPSDEKLPLIRTGAPDFRTRQMVRRICDDPALRKRFSALALALGEREWPLQDVYSDYAAALAARCPPELGMNALQVQAGELLAARFSRTRGEKAGWSYSDAEAFCAALKQVLEACAQVGGTLGLDHAIRRQRDNYAGEYDRLFVRAADPYVLCGDVCGALVAGAGPCRYRTAVAEHHASDRQGIDQVFERVVDACLQERDWSRLSAFFRRHMGAVIGAVDTKIPSACADRVSACFAQQVMRDWPVAEVRTIVQATTLKGERDD